MKIQTHSETRKRWSRAKMHSTNLTRCLPGTWLRDKNLVRSHHLPGQMDSGYEANSIAFRNHTYAALEVNNGLAKFPEGSRTLLPGGLRFDPLFQWLLGGHNAAVHTKREKAIAARRAPVDRQV